MYGGGGGRGWHTLMRSDETKPQMTRKLLVRVLSYARSLRLADRRNARDDFDLHRP